MLAQQPSPCDPTDRTVHLLDSKDYIRDWLKSPAGGSPAEELDVLLEAGGDPWGEGGRWGLTRGRVARGVRGADGVGGVRTRRWWSLDERPRSRRLLC